MVVRPGKSNLGPDHLSRVDLGEDAKSIDVTVLNV